MRYLILFLSLLSVIILTAFEQPGCSYSQSADRVPLVSDTLSVPLVGEWWGYYGGYGYGYGLDADDDPQSHEALVRYTSGVPIPEYVDCDTIDGSPIGFHLDLRGADWLPEEARISADDCRTAARYDVEALEISFAAYDPPHDSGGVDGYGDMLVLIWMPSGTLLEVSGPFSHCVGGEPCY